MEHRLCLVLNKHWKPISFCSVYHGVSKMMNERACMLSLPSYELVTAKEWMKMLSDNSESGILTTRGYLPAPEIIITKFYEKMIFKNPSCNRKNLLKRDGLRCQYTGEELSKENATIDHLLPRCRGGRTTWDNCVVASFNFNNKKGPRTPEEINKFPMSNPSKPAWSLIDYIPETYEVPSSWRSFLGELSDK
jgi:hypothetical protein